MPRINQNNLKPTPGSDIAAVRLDAEIERTIKKLSLLFQQREALRQPLNTDQGPLMFIEKKRAVDQLSKSTVN